MTAAMLTGTSASGFALFPDHTVFVAGQIDVRVAYKGGMGPVFFSPDEWADAIESYLEASPRA